MSHPWRNGPSRHANALREEVESWRVFAQRIQDATELAQLDDESLRAELEAEAESIEKELEKRSFTAMLSGRYDSENALAGHPCRGWRYRFAGLGGDAAAHVPALGRKAWVRNRDS